ncbi:NIN-like protein [Artemisia annua]|uniref:NIN-like protein n=1 Tax=Artemisia annua TaxID=35608 RepID=A0A2U1NXN1_ARTAN|nr:NIN-like protein [Artemisia annua]
MELFKSDGSEDFFCSGIGWTKDMLSKKMSIEAPALALSGKSRYLPKLCVFGNRKGVSQSDSTITGAGLELRADAVNQNNQIIHDKIEAALKLLIFRKPYVLAQFWLQHVIGNDQILTTKDQPYGVGGTDERLLLYRRDSERYLYAVGKDHEEEEGDISPPVRVFRRGLPEWTVDLTNYLPKHFPQQECAIGCDLHGYLALPVFDLTTRSCVGVIELLTSSKYVSYAHEVQQFHSALKTQNLSCPQAFDGTAYVPRQNELDKIMGILKTMCDIHNLPLAQTWVVSPSTSFVSHDKIIKKCCCSFDTKCIGKVCMSTTALPFYLKDLPKWQFRKACAERHLEQSSHGAVGRALLCRNLCFCRDVTILNAEEYSLVYLARMSKLASCFAIYLHSVENGDDYVLEFFLPPGMEDGRCVQDVVETLKQKIEGDPGFKLGSTESSDSESVVTDVSDTASSASTNVTSLEKRGVGAFIDDGEDSSPFKKVKTV